MRRIFLAFAILVAFAGTLGTTLAESPPKPKEQEPPSFPIEIEGEERIPSPGERFEDYPKPVSNAWNVYDELTWNTKVVLEYRISCLSTSWHYGYDTRTITNNLNVFTNDRGVVPAFVQQSRGIAGGTFGAVGRAVLTDDGRDILVKGVLSRSVEATLSARNFSAHWDGVASTAILGEYVALSLFRANGYLEEWLKRFDLFGLVPEADLTVNIVMYAMDHPGSKQCEREARGEKKPRDIAYSHSGDLVDHTGTIVDEELVGPAD